MSSIFGKNECIKNNFCIFKIDIAWGIQKSGIILGNKISLNFNIAKTDQIYLIL